ncbi:A-kinase-interacting protein 1 isoform X1 [Trachemys scripta elegans]|uniref:A-kinase-interacting protein 1 isoform X1 n=1 Tax=Trachemys scripta elegans TaxID=31138 RepID=UPI001552BF89|nr:A-kinase-interacting protein 1 isoform X1 [Trachemys scripta elegans]
MHCPCSSRRHGPRGARGAAAAAAAHRPAVGTSPRPAEAAAASGAGSLALISAGREALLPARLSLCSQPPCCFLPPFPPALHRDTEEDSERLNAAFASVVEFMSRTTKECEKYYSYVPASRCQENEIKHICRYHSRQAAENLLQTLEQEKNETSPVSNPAEIPKQLARKASKDLYIEVSPGTYSVTATSDDMVKQTHMVDVNAGQSIDLTFSI